MESNYKFYYTTLLCKSCYLKAGYMNNNRPTGGRVILDSLCLFCFCIWKVEPSFAKSFRATKFLNAGDMCN